MPRSERPTHEPRDSAPSEPVQALLDLAESVPPEFGADALARLAASSQFLSPRRRTLALEDAFRLAASAQNALKLDALPGTEADSRSGILSMAYGAGLDSLSLRTRAARELIAVDKRAALRLFREIPIPVPGALTCSDRLTPDLESYYTLLPQIARILSTDHEEASERPLDLMARQIGAIASPVQVPLVIRCVRGVGGQARDLELLVSVLGSALYGVGVDYRSFARAGPDLLRELSLLSNACGSKGVSNAAFLDSVHKYFVRQLRGPRCGNSATDRELASALIRDYNEGIRSMAVPSGAPLPEIAESDAKPDKIEDDGPSDRLWKDAGGRQFDAQVRELRAQRSGLAENEWRARLLDLLSRLADWKQPDDAPALDYLHEKCVLLKTLLEMAPDAGSRESVLGAYLLFLGQWDPEQDRIEWFLHARELLAIVGHAGGSKRSARIDGELRSVRSPTLMLYLKLDSLIPNS